MLTGAERDTVSLTPLSSLLGWPRPRRGPGWRGTQLRLQCPLLTTMALRSPNLSTAPDTEAAARSLSAQAPRASPDGIVGNLPGSSLGSRSCLCGPPGPNPQGCPVTACTPSLGLRLSKEHEHVPWPLLSLLEMSLSLVREKALRLGSARYYQADTDGRGRGGMPALPVLRPPPRGREVGSERIRRRPRELRKPKDGKINPLF